MVYLAGMDGCWRGFGLGMTLIDLYDGLLLVNGDIVCRRSTIVVVGSCLGARGGITSTTLSSLLVV